MMKKILLCISLLSSSFISAQTFSGPESIEYDAVNSRWLVGQSSSHKVLIYNPANGGLSELCTGMSVGPYGIEILGSVLYCCDGGRVKGYDLTSGALVFNVNLSATFLNGITSDGGSNLFVTDYSAKKIYRLNVLTSMFNVMTTTIKSPNGIIYDGDANRCVFVTWGSNAPVQAMSLSDSTISTLITTTLSNCDGIIRDQQKYWYLSAWGSGSLNKTDSAFSYMPTPVMTGLSSPADLGINSAGDSIGIPNSGAANNVVFYAIPNSTGINEAVSHQLNLFPNPASNRISISIDEPVTDGIIELINSSGKIIASDKANGMLFFIDRSEFPTGNYFVRISSNRTKTITKKIIFN